MFPIDVADNYAVRGGDPVDLTAKTAEHGNRHSLYPLSLRPHASCPRRDQP